MSDDTSRGSADAPWLHPRAEDRGLGGYLRTLRERRWLVLLAVVLCTGAAVAYVLRADKVYESEAAILVTPVPDTSEVLVSVGLISTSVDPAARGRDRRRADRHARGRQPGAAGPRGDPGG